MRFRYNKQEVDKLACKNKGKCLSFICSGAHDILDWECSFGHIFPMRVYCVKQGQWCPKCSKNRTAIKLKRKNVKETLEKVNMCLLSEYENDNIPVKVCCSKNHIYYVVFKCLLKSGGCKFCNKEKAINSRKEEIKNKVLIQNGQFLNTDLKDVEFVCDKNHKTKIRVQNLMIGSWCKICGRKNSIFKMEQTLERKYGVRHNMQIPEIALKAAQSQNNSSIYFHWNTGKKIVCVGSFESSVIEYLNKNQIDYNFQPQTFLMPSGKTYTPDLYLNEQNLWVEVKGRFIGDAREKWDWFRSEYPNSELWDKEKLKQLGLWKRILELQRINKQKQEKITEISVSG